MIGTQTVVQIVDGGRHAVESLPHLLSNDRPCHVDRGRLHECDDQLGATRWINAMFLKHLSRIDEIMFGSHPGLPHQCVTIERYPVHFASCRRKKKPSL